jgi:hypothetical protein
VDVAAQGVHKRQLAPAVLLGLVVLAWLAAHLDFLVDDAFITFRYAKHLADGHGLVWNIGEHPPIEGFSNFGWVLFCTALEKLGADPALWTRIAGIVSAAVLVALVARLASTRFSDGSTTLWTAAFVASLPPLAMWATGGLETMTFSLAVFGVFERLTLDRTRPRVLHASLWAASAVLLRADGFVWVAIALAAVFALWLRERAPALLRALLVVAAVTALVAGAYVAFRFAYFGELEPNTARIKVLFGAKYLTRGVQYVASLLLCVVSIPPVLVGSMRKIRGDASGLVAPCVVAVLASFAYLIVLSGDWMMMYRMLVPAMPFIALLFAACVASLRTDVVRGAYAIVCIALSILPAYDLHVVPKSWRESAHFRWSQEYRTEYAMWRKGVDDITDWIELGRGVAAYTRPGDSMIVPNIGAVGYYAPELVCYDTQGLTNREPLTASEHDMPGHDFKVDMGVFETYRPTYFIPQLVDAGNPFAHIPKKWLEPDFDKFELNVWPLDPRHGFRPGKALLLVKYKR